jgi:hypothetical protein
MSERQGSAEGKGEGRGRSYAIEQNRSRLSGSPDSERSLDFDLRDVGDREVWSATMEATITDADVEAGESRRAEQFED